MSNYLSFILYLKEGGRKRKGQNKAGHRVLCCNFAKQFCIHFLQNFGERAAQNESPNLAICKMVRNDALDHSRIWDLNVRTSSMSNDLHVVKICTLVKCEVVHHCAWKNTGKEAVLSYPAGMCSDTSILIQIYG